MDDEQQVFPDTLNPQGLGEDFPTGVLLVAQRGFVDPCTGARTFVSGFV
jgi:hypothetical protein